MKIARSEVAVLVRDAAREELLPRFSRVERQHKADGSILTEADLAMHRRLEREFADAWPSVGFLSEEMPHAEQEALLQSGTTIWCLDPLDGTNNFAAGVPLFSVSLALIRDGRSTLGIVYDPTRDECFIAERDRGAQLNGAPLRSMPLSIDLRQAVALLDYKRLRADVRETIMRHLPFSSQRNLGSCALEWGWMAAGRSNICLHGGQQIWDYAAGSLILEEAGGFSCTLLGEPVFAPNLKPRSVVSALDQALFDAWRSWLAEHL